MGPEPQDRSCRCMFVLPLILGLLFALSAPLRADAAFQLTATEAEWLAQHRDIRIGIMDKWPPLDFVNEAGVPNGVGVSYVEELNKRLGGILTIVPAPFSDNMEAVKTGELDALLDITPKPDREEFFSFTTPYLTIPHVIVGRNDSEYFSSEQDLVGKTVALEKGFYNIVYFHEQHHGVNIREYANTSAALDAVSRGEADAYAGNRAVAIYLINRELILNLRLMGKLVKPPVVLTIGVRKDWPELTAILDRALADIPEETRLAICKEWFPEQREAALPVTVELSDTEQEWVLAHPVIRLGIDPEFAPFEFIDGEGHYAGIASEYIELLNQRLGLDMQVVPGKSWNEAVALAKQGEIDVLPCVGITAERKEYFAYSHGYIDFHRVMITRLDAPFIAGLEDVGGWRLAVQANSSHEGFLKERGNVPYQTFNTLQELLLALSDGRVDVIVGNVTSSTYWIRKLNLTNLKIAAPVSQEVESLHFAVRKDWGDTLAPLLNRGLESITAEEKQAIRQRWVGVEYERGWEPETILKIGLVVGLAVVLILAWNYRLKKEIEKRKKIQQVLTGLTEELSRANDQLKELDRLKSMFLASMSHELRTPLNSIIGFTGLLLMEMAGPLSDEQRKQLAMVKSSAAHLLNLINDILDISRIEAGRIDLTITQFALADLVPDLEAMVGPQAAGKGLSLKFDIPAGLQLASDRRRLEQVLINLIGNAVKFTEQGEVAVTASRADNGTVIVAVADTGIGISSVELETLFQPFHQLDMSGTKRYEGTGLGLYLSRKLAGLLHGEISVTSEPGRGSVFTVKLPVRWPGRER